VNVGLVNGYWQLLRWRKIVQWKPVWREEPAITVEPSPAAGRQNSSIIIVT